MAGLIETLRELHRIHRQLADLHERRERGPAQLRARQASVAKLQEGLAGAQGEVKAARVLSDQKQLALKTGEDKVKQLQVKLNQAASNREYQLLKEQIAADNMASSVLQDEILELMDKVESLKGGVGEAEQALAKGKAELDKASQLVRQQLELIAGDVARLEAELSTVEARLPEELRADYLRIIKSRGSEGMAAVEGESCGGCYQHMTPNMFSDLRLEKTVFCKSCGRLLYLPEDRSPGK